jgi:hypothetical protein
MNYRELYRTLTHAEYVFERFKSTEEEQAKAATTIAACLREMAEARLTRQALNLIFHFEDDTQFSGYEKLAWDNASGK